MYGNIFIMSEYRVFTDLKIRFILFIFNNDIFEFYTKCSFRKLYYFSGYVTHQ